MSKRLVVAGVGALLVGAAAVGGVALLGGGSDGAPAAIRIVPNGGAAGGAVTEAAAADRMSILPMWREEYVLSGDLPALDDPAPAWVARPQEWSADDVARLAAAFGLDGSPARQEYGAWTVGPQDGSGPSLSLMDTGTGDWWYGNPTVSSIAPCAEVAPEPAAPGDTPTTAPVLQCPEPTPPADLPADADALAREAAIAEVLGASGDDDVRVTRDEWGVTVERRVRLGDVLSPFVAATRFGAAGQVEYANGTLGRFEPAGDYPRIGTAEAFARLQAGRPFPWMAQPLARGAVDPAVSEVAVEPAVDPAVTESAGDPAVSGPAPDPLVDPAPPEVRTVVIVTVEPSLWSVPGAEGEVWLVPAYRFGSADQAGYEVIAVPDDLLEAVSPTPVEPLPEPAPLPAETLPAPTVPAPLPPDQQPTTTLVPPAPLPTTSLVPVAPPTGPTGPPATALEPGGTVPGRAPDDPADPALAVPYVGLPEAEALARAEAEGRPARVVSRDGEQFPVTMDYDPNRLNLVVVDGIVTEARFG